MNLFLFYGEPLEILGESRGCKTYVLDGFFFNHIDYALYGFMAFCFMSLYFSVHLWLFCYYTGCCHVL